MCHQWSPQLFIRNFSPCCSMNIEFLKRWKLTSWPQAVNYKLHTIKFPNLLFKYCWVCALNVHSRALYLSQPHEKWRAEFIWHMNIIIPFAMHILRMRTRIKVASIFWIFQTKSPPGGPFGTELQYYERVQLHCCRSVKESKREKGRESEYQNIRSRRTNVRACIFLHRLPKPALH